MDRHIDASPGFCLCAALALLLLPLRWILAWAAASALHELGHFLALRSCGVRIFGFTLTGGGALLSVDEMSPVQEFFCAVSGPAVSLMLLFLLPWAPLVAFCGLIQGMFNLIPVMPFDGGRALGSFLQLWVPGKKDQIVQIVERMVFFVILALGIWSLIALKAGVAGWMLWFFLLQKLSPVKIPCKAAGKRVQ